VTTPNLVGVEPDNRSPLSLRNLFFHHDAHPLTLGFALARAFGVEWVQWEAETIWASIKDMFKTDVSELCKTKIQTVKTLTLVDTPWTSWQVFEKVVQGLNNNIPRFDIMQQPTLEQIFTTVDVMTTYWPDGGPWSDEVKLYIAAVFLHENVCFAPAPLDFVQMEISQPYLICKDCGNHEDALFHDGVCDTCTQKFNPAKTLDFQPHPELAGAGKNVEYHLRYDPDEVQARWSQVEGKPEDVLQENAIDVQVAKLFDAKQYMLKRRRQLAQQLTEMKSWLGAS
jgi:hypothetical protein